MASLSFSKASVINENNITGCEQRSDVLVSLNASQHFRTSPALQPKNKSKSMHTKRIKEARVLKITRIKQNTRLEKKLLYPKLYLT